MFGKLALYIKSALPKKTSFLRTHGLELSNVVISEKLRITKVCPHELGQKGAETDGVCSRQFRYSFHDIKLAVESVATSP